ncbi:MAG: HEPN domain-containing protein [Clostridiales bacterium]|nr:HEPN domain-containing protein [Clostridiales bacterium]
MKLAKADADINAAKLLLSLEGNPTNDEMLTDLAAYHAQQGIEKSLKYLLSTFGGIDETDKKFRTHQIPTLIALVKQYCQFEVPDELVNMAPKISSWEAKTRYDDSPIAYIDEINHAIKLYDSMYADILAYAKG